MIKTLYSSFPALCMVLQKENILNISHSSTEVLTPGCRDLVFAMAHRSDKMVVLKGGGRERKKICFEQLNQSQAQEDRDYVKLL